MIEKCPQLIAKMQERNATPTQNVQMIAVEKIPVPSLNIVTRSGVTTQVQNKGKQLDEAWVHRTPETILAFDVGREKGTFMEAKKHFADLVATTAVIVSGSFT